MSLSAFALFACVCAAIPCFMFIANRRLFLMPVSPDVTLPKDRSSVSILIPARNEASGIRAAIAAIQSNQSVQWEVIVLDDDSEDATAQIVEEISASDPRVRLVRGKPLPAGWNGKQHACFQLSEVATYDRILFIDADVRLRPDSLARLMTLQDQTGVSLLSAFPHQETGTWFEKWMIPLMHFILLGFLPMSRMRQSTSPAYAAGCGQLFLTYKTDYKKAGTHQAIAKSRHDGLKLPRAYREAGLSTDCVDGTDLADCRMYRSAGEVYRGLSKNAIEGIANPRIILPFTVMLLGGSVLGIITLALALLTYNLVAAVLSIAAIVMFHIPRIIAATQFRQSWIGVICHIPSVFVFVWIQWQSLVNHLIGRRTPWRGRLG